MMHHAMMPVMLVVFDGPMLSKTHSGKSDQK
jgi:hypothetical protein